MVAIYVPPHQPVHVMTIRGVKASLLAASLSFGVLWGAAVASAGDEAKKYYNQGLQQNVDGLRATLGPAARSPGSPVRPRLPARVSGQEPGGQGLVDATRQAQAGPCRRPLPAGDDGRKSEQPG